MPIILPANYPSGLLRFAACAHVDEPNERTRQLIEEGHRIEHDARAEDYLYHSLVSRWSNGVGHFHFDIAHQSELPDDYSPKSEMATVLGAWDEFFGQAVAVSVRTKFSIPLADLPPVGIIQSLNGVAAIVGGSESTITGARLALSPEPFGTLSWDAQDENAVVKLSLSEDDLILGSNFVHDLMAKIEEGLGRFVFEREPVDE